MNKIILILTIFLGGIRLNAENISFESKCSSKGGTYDGGCICKGGTRINPFVADCSDIQILVDKKKECKSDVNCNMKDVLGVIYFKDSVVQLIGDPNNPATYYYPNGKETEELKSWARKTDGVLFKGFNESLDDTAALNCNGSTKSLMDDYVSSMRSGRVKMAKSPYYKKYQNSSIVPRRNQIYTMSFLFKDRTINLACEENKPCRPSSENMQTLLERRKLASNDDYYDVSQFNSDQTDIIYFCLKSGREKVVQLYQQQRNSKVIERSGLLNIK